MIREDRLFDALDAGYIVINAEHKVILWNKWMERHSGIQKDKALGQDFTKVFPTIPVERFLEAVTDCIDTGLSSIMSDRFNKSALPLFVDKIQTKRIDQRILISRFRGTDNEKLCLVQITDLTVANQREQYLMDQSSLLQSKNIEIEHQNKMASLGRMASGIVHEINNPISIIKGFEYSFTKMMKSEQVDKDKLKEMFDKIQQMAERVSHIIKGLKVIAHKDNFEFDQVVPLRQIINESVELSQVKLEKTPIVLHVEEIPEKFEVFCDSVQISQIIINLVSNAIDEIENKEKPWINISCHENGKYYDIRITDCGKGIPKEMQKNIFDPFYTSKKQGKGTGLGLSISQKIAEAHKGSLFIDNEAPNTTFVLRLFKAIYWS